MPAHPPDSNPTEISPPIRHLRVVPLESSGKRLDVFWTAELPGVSRTQIGRSIDAGLAQVDGKHRKASYRLSEGETLAIELKPAAEGPIPEDIALDILYEDDVLAVVNKPPGMVVHPARGHWSGTLASALAAHFQRLSGAGGPTRPGIVHRLDRDTSGAIVVAKTDAAHHALASQFQARSIRKQYLAIVVGTPDRQRDRIDFPIGPHPSHREKKALRADHPESRPAETFYEVVEVFRGFALVRAEPKTGRTHQIRLHLAHVGLPVLCDRLYGGRSQISGEQLRQATRLRRAAAWTATDDLDDDAVLLDRQALHSHRLRFTHPVTGNPVEIEAPLRADMDRLLVTLRQLALLG